MDHPQIDDSQTIWGRLGFRKCTARDQYFAGDVAVVCPILELESILFLIALSDMHISFNRYLQL